MSRRPKATEPKNISFKEAGALDTRTEKGRAALWLERIRRAKELHDIDARKSNYEEAMLYFNGAVMKGDGEVYLNEAYSTFKNLIRQTVPGIPPVEAEARHTDQELMAQVCGSLLDGLFDSGVADTECVMLDVDEDATFAGIGFYKTPWYARFQELLYRPTGNEAYLMPHVQRAQAENEQPEYAQIADTDDHGVHAQMHSGVPGLENHVAEHQNLLTSKVQQLPDIERVSPWRFVYDPDVTRWRDRSWEAELTEMLITTLQDIPDIKNLTPENCDAATRDETDNPTSESSGGNSFDFAKTRIRVWLIHDRDVGEYIILPDMEGCKPLLEAQWPYPGMDIYNCLVHTDDRIPGKIHGHSLLINSLPKLRELAKTNASIRRHVRRAANAKMVGPRGALTREDKQSMETEENWLAEVSPEAASMMKQFNPPPLPEEVIAYRELLLSELRRDLGLDIMSSGGDTPHAITASEAQLRGGYQATRIDKRKEDIEKHLEWIARNWIMLVRNFGDEAVTVRIMGPEGPELLALDPSSIPDDLAFSMDIEALNRDEKAEKLQAHLNWAQFMLTTVPGVLDPIKVGLWLGKDMGIRNPERFIAGLQAPTLQPGEPGGQGQIPNSGEEQGPPPTPTVPQLTP